MSKYIITADWHLRDNRPLCRTDTDWIESQRYDIQFVINEANKRSADIINAGDIFDVPRTAPSIVNLLLNELKQVQNKFYLIAGNHSLQYHNQENLMNSSIGALATLDNNIKYLPCIDNTKDGIFEHAAILENEDIAIVHTLTFPDKESIPFGARGKCPEELFASYNQKIIVTGDYHRNFIANYEGRILINPGCLNIQSADMLDYQPIIYYIDTSTMNIESIEVPVDRSVLTDNHIKEKTERDNRIASFIDTVKKQGTLTLSFEDNLKKALLMNDIPEGVINIIDEIAQEV